MPAIARILGVRIEFYFAEHPPPHFHAVGGGEKVQIEIGTWRVLRGSMAQGKLRAVLEWAMANEAVLMQAWDDSRNHIDPRRER
jgi:Domain of unknown function (DUF4160)